MGIIVNDIILPYAKKNIKIFLVYFILVILSYSIGTLAIPMTITQFINSNMKPNNSFFKNIYKQIQDETSVGIIYTLSILSLAYSLFTYYKFVVQNHILELHSISFTDLTTNQFFELLKLRISVFVVEQNCPYQELDNLDLISGHFFGSLDGKIIALGRVYRELDTVFIGRIAVKRKYRKNGYARKIMEFILQEVKTKFPDLTIELSAQEYLINFYASLGFVSQGNTYLEDGIPHIKMTYFN